MKPGRCPELERERCVSRDQISHFLGDRTRQQTAAKRETPKISRGSPGIFSRVDQCLRREPSEKGEGIVRVRNDACSQQLDWRDSSWGTDEVCSQEGLDSVVGNN